jgi:hypothetical protein
MEYINLGNTYTIANIPNLDWVGVVDVVDNIANVQLGNSEVTLSIPITTTDVTQDIKNYLGITND